MSNSFKIHVLGCGSAKPTLRHQPSSTVINHRENLFMVDCGEGAQRAFQAHRLNFSRLGHIFLTHLHGDHVLGLPGLVSTLGLGGTGGSLTIHTFAEGAEILSNIFKFFARDIPFEIKFNIIDPKAEAVVFENSSLTVRTIPLRHRVPDVGYIFEEKPNMRHIRRDMIDFHKVPVAKIHDIKAGADFIKPDGTVIPNVMLTSDPTPSRSYAHISDTSYLPYIAEKIGAVDLLYHETTYLNQHEKEAKDRFHSTARQAAMVARDAGAKQLLVGHYSSRYKTDEDFRKEALDIFPNVILGKEGLVIDL